VEVDGVNMGCPAILRAVSGAVPVVGVGVGLGGGGGGVQELGGRKWAEAVVLSRRTCGSTSACSTENGIGPPGTRVRIANLLTPKDLLGENQQIRKRVRPADLPA